MITLTTGNTLKGKAGTTTAITYTISGDSVTTTDSFQILGQGQLPTSTGDLLTTTPVPAATQLLIKEIQLANTTALPVTGITFYVNGTAAANQINGGLTIPANGSATYDAEGVWRIYGSDGLLLSTIGGAAGGDLTGSYPNPILATVNANVGSFGSATQSLNLTVNGKGLVTAASANSIQIAESQVTNLVTDLAGKQATGNYITALTGDVTASGPGSSAATLVNIPTGTTAAGSILHTNIAAPGTPVAGKVSLYTDSTSKNIAVKNDVGVVNHGIQTRTATANNWIRSIADDGSTTISQPAAADISGLGTLATQSGTFSGTSSGTNTGDQTISLSGDVTASGGTGALTTTVTKINGTSLAGLATGILKNTTTTGVPSIATAGTDYLAPAAIGTTVQAFDSDLTTIAGLTATTNNTIQAVASAWASVTPTAHTATLDLATASLKGLMSASQFNFLSAYNGSGIIFVTANSYSNLLCDGATDDLAALNALYSAAPDGSKLVWPGQNKTMVLSGAAVVPAGKHFIHIGGGAGNKTNVLQTSLTANHFTAGDWYSTWEGFNFTSTSVTATGVQALSSGTVLNINPITTALVPATGSINVGSAIGWQVLTYSARTSTTVTLSSTGTGNSIAGAPVVFKTAGAAIDAGNYVGIDCISNTFTSVFNGYICSGSTSNQSRIVGNNFLNTINFDIQIDAANWNGIIDSNTMDCTTNSRSVSHCEINQCGSLTGQGNQFIRGQSNLRLGSTSAAYPAGVFGVYFSNCFFDNAGADAIKVQGISAVQRVKITSSWISSAAANGVNFASTASTLPTDLEFIGCNVYSNTTAGFAGAGVADYKVIGGQVAGNGVGFNITPATGNVYSITASGVRIGPTGGIGANTTGINIITGTYTQIKFTDCDVTGNTTAYTQAAIGFATYSRFAIINCPGINPKGAVSTPAVGASTVAVVNQTGFRVTVWVKNGTTSPTVTTVNGVAITGFTTATVSVAATTIQLDPGGTIAFTYTVVPTWIWVAN